MSFVHVVIQNIVALEVELGEFAVASQSVECQALIELVERSHLDIRFWVTPSNTGCSLCGSAVLAISELPIWFADVITHRLLPNAPFERV